MLKTCITTFLTILFAMVIVGCAEMYGETKLDKNWGRSFESAKHSQILNPEAGKNQESVVGREGRVEERIMEKHISGKKDKDGSTSPEFGVLTIKQ